MKIHSLLLSGLALLILASCYAPPRAARGPYSPGGRVVTPMERNNRSPLSPGGVVVTPRERQARRHGRY